MKETHCCRREVCHNAVPLCASEYESLPCTGASARVLACLCVCVYNKHTVFVHKARCLHPQTLRYLNTLCKDYSNLGAFLKSRGEFCTCSTPLFGIGYILIRTLHYYIVFLNSDWLLSWDWLGEEALQCEHWPALFNVVLHADINTNIIMEIWFKQMICLILFFFGGLRFQFP